MAVTGTGAISLRKQDLQGSKPIAVGFKKLVFAHRADAGETGISLSTLSTPSDLSSKGFLQPDPSDLAAAKLLFYRKNLTIVSSSKGILQDYLSYTVSTNDRINWEGFTADQDEIFMCIVDHEPQTGLQTVDASPMTPATGTLLSGTQDFNVGEAFVVNKYPTAQIGAVIVTVDGVLQLRNVGNATAAPGADGNYQEIDNGSGLGVTIRFNTTEAYDRSVAVYSNGVLVNRPDASRDQVIETLATVIDIMIPDLALATGNAESKYQGAPSQQDLKAFSEKVSKLERYRIVSSTEEAVGPVDLILGDTSGGAFTLDLPADPNTGDRVVIMDAEGTFGTFTFTVGRNGHLIDGVAADFLMNSNDAWVEFVYVNSSRGWVVRI